MRYSLPLLFSLTIGLSGCGIMPHIDCEKAKKVSTGMSESEVIKLMGDPYVVQLSMQKGKQEKILGWQNEESIAASQNMLRIKVTSDGKISEVSGNCAGQTLGK